MAPQDVEQTYHVIALTLSLKIEDVVTECLLIEWF